MANQSDNHRIRILVAETPEPWKDPDELLSLDPDGDAKWEKMIADAKPITEWAIDHLDDRFDVETVAGKQDAADDMIDHLLTLPVVERVVYIGKLSRKLGIPEDDLREAMGDAMELRQKASTATERAKHAWNIEDDDESLTVPVPEFV